ncbi:MAG TPA: hypothetical protein VK974_10010 [Methylophilaceae bacterium]|nr:hypothetical protein [Methylophilaceae bacterium]
MRYIYPNAKPQAKRKTHPVVFVAAISLILFSIAGTASVLGFKPLAQFNQAGSASSETCANRLMGHKDTSASGAKSTFESNMPTVDSDNSDDVFKTPVIRA